MSSSDCNLVEDAPIWVYGVGPPSVRAASGALSFGRFYINILGLLSLF